MAYYTEEKQGVHGGSSEQYPENKEFTKSASPGTRSKETMHSAKASRSRKQIRPRI